MAADGDPGVEGGDGVDGVLAVDDRDGLAVGVLVGPGPAGGR